MDPVSPPRRFPAQRLSTEALIRTWRSAGGTVSVEQAATFLEQMNQELGFFRVAADAAHSSTEYTRRTSAIRHTAHAERIGRRWPPLEEDFEHVLRRHDPEKQSRAQLFEAIDQHVKRHGLRGASLGLRAIADLTLFLPVLVDASAPFATFDQPFVREAYAFLEQSAMSHPNVAGYVLVHFGLGLGGDTQGFTLMHRKGRLHLGLSIEVLSEVQQWASLRPRDDKERLGCPARSAAHPVFDNVLRAALVRAEKVGREVLWPRAMRTATSGRSGSPVDDSWHR